MSTATAPRARTGRQALIAVAVLVVVAVVWWGSPVGRGRGSSPPSAPQGLQVQSAVGAAIAGQWDQPTSGTAPTSYVVHVVPAGGGAPVASARSWSTSVVVGGLAVGGSYRLEVAPASAPGVVAVSAPVVVGANRVPDPPVSVSAAQVPGTDALRVAWTPAATGDAADGAVVQLNHDGASGDSLVCRARCTSATFWGLPYGGIYSVRVVAINGAGQGPPAASGPVVLSDPCRGGASCVSIDATSATGPAQPRAVGFLNSLYPGGDMVRLTKALDPLSWRGSPNYRPGAGLDWSSWDAALAAGAQTTLILSNLWHAETANAGGAAPPWSNWGAYSRWVTATVHQVEGSGHQVDYWDIQNEPGAPSFYSPAAWAASTVADFLQQFLVAYRAIKAADPDAKIIGPSMAAFADYPGEYDTHQPDLVTFLDFAASHNLQLAAVTWHEIDDSLGPNPRDSANVPEIVESHVAEARALVADRPALGDPQVWVNEYGRPSDYEIPGWTLGDIASLEAAGVDRAGRSCWPEPVGGAVVDDCAASSLDGLLAANGSAPRANYWVYATYAQMTGQLVTATSSDATISVLATRRESDHRVVAMVGRHVGCLPSMNASCTGTNAVAVPPTGVTVGVRVPWKGPSASVNLSTVLPSWAPVAAPTVVFRGSVPVVDGLLALPLQSVADGQVYLVTINRP